MTTHAADPTERLEDGLGIDTPVGDNLVLDFTRCEADAFAAIASAGGGCVDDDPTLGVRFADLAVASPFGNTAVLQRPVDDHDTPALANALQSFFGRAAGGPYLVFSPWRLDLSAHGFSPVGHPPLMLRPAGAIVSGAPELRIEQVTDETRLADFERTLVEAYPVPEMQPWKRAALFGPAVLDSGWLLFVGYVDDEPVATAGAHVGSTLTAVEVVSTRPEFRRRGFGEAVTAAATGVQGDKPAMLIASDLGRATYQRMGYLPLQRHSLWLGMR